MGVYTLEEGNSKETDCPCCGRKSRTVWGYIYRDGEGRAVYYVSWTQGHQEKGASFLLSIGNRQEGADPAERQAVALEFRIIENRPEFMVVDASDTRWNRHETLGQMLRREQVLTSAIKEEVFGLADGILVRDSRVRQFLYQIRE